MSGAAARWPIRPLEPEDRAWLDEVLDASWGGSLLAYGGEVVDASVADGMVARDAAGNRVGVLLHRFHEGGWEVVLLHALRPGEGIGTALLDACASAAREAGTSHLSLVTTNDNLEAIGFYQRRGFRLAILRAGAVDVARRDAKPTIPEIGQSGIPIRDEIELVRELG